MSVLSRILPFAWAIFGMQVNLQAADPAREPADVEQEVAYIESALAQWNRAAVAQDHDVLRAYLWAANDPERKLVEAHTQRILSAVRLFKVKDRLEDNKEFRIGRLPADFLSLLMTEWEVRGNTAVQKDAQTVPEDKKLPTLINVGGIWKINVTPHPPSPSMQALIDAIHRQAQIVNQIAQAIEDGKIKSVKEVNLALDSLPKFAAPTDALDLVLTLPQPVTPPQPGEKRK